MSKAVSIGPQRRRTALVTGASAGIGQAFARELARRDFDLVLTARRRERLVELRDELTAGRTMQVEVMPADLADPEAPQALFDSLLRKGIAVDLLVNNAGYNIAAKYADTSWKQQADFIQVLITAVAQLTHLFLPGMLERGWGRIINVASLAGLLYGAPGATLYSGAKSFLIKLSEALSLELVGTRVCVTALCPGFTFSEFHDVNGMRSRMGKLPGALWMDADTVARQGIEASLEGRTVLVNGALNRVIASGMKHLPTPLARGIMRRQAKNFRRV
jgi:short-subunit dehydrogenase